MSATAVDRLRRFAGRAPEHCTCDLCRSELTDRHRHLLQLAHRRIMCACDACAMLFSDANASRFRPIPQSVTRIELQLSDEAWAGLGIPIGMACFTPQASELTTNAEATAAPVLVGYPSPAGPVMSSLEQDAWRSLIDANPDVGRIRPEVESLLINRTANRQQAYIVPLDVCFELIGIVRRDWQGWSGGPEVHREIDRFFEKLELTAEASS